MQEKAIRLRNMLEIAVEQGVRLFQKEKPATPLEIARVQGVNEECIYMPEFIVKDNTGEIKEIWYSGIISKLEDEKPSI